MSYDIFKAALDQARIDYKKAKDKLAEKEEKHKELELEIKKLNNIIEALDRLINNDYKESK